ncbi:MAG: hypothetical protein ACPGUV_05030, partial [Polyangiales bacterium]
MAIWACMLALGFAVLTPGQVSADRKVSLLGGSFEGFLGKTIDDPRRDLFGPLLGVSGYLELNATDWLGLQLGTTMMWAAPKDAPDNGNWFAMNL